MPHYALQHRVLFSLPSGRYHSSPIWESQISKASLQREKKQSKPIFKARFWKPSIKSNFQRLAFRGQTSKPVFNGEPLEKNHQSRFPKQVFGDQASKPIFNGKPLEGNMNPQIPCRVSTHMKTRAATCKTDQKRNIGLHRQGEACR